MAEKNAPEPQETAKDDFDKVDPTVTVNNDGLGANSIYVELIGVAWTRNNPETGRVRTHRKGARFYVTEAEYDLLSVGFKPSLRKVNEDA